MQSNNGQITDRTKAINKQITHRYKNYTVNVRCLQSFIQKKLSQSSS